MDREKRDQEIDAFLIEILRDSDPELYADVPDLDSLPELTQEEQEAMERFDIQTILKEFDNGTH